MEAKGPHHGGGPAPRTVRGDADGDPWGRHGRAATGRSGVCAPRAPDGAARVSPGRGHPRAGGTGGARRPSIGSPAPTGAYRFRVGIDGGAFRAHERHPSAPPAGGGASAGGKEEDGRQGRPQPARAFSAPSALPGRPSSRACHPGPGARRPPHASSPGFRSGAHPPGRGGGAGLPGLTPGLVASAVRWPAAGPSPRRAPPGRSHSRSGRFGHAAPARPAPWPPAPPPRPRPPPAGPCRRVR